jgi:hypothetical protein
MYGNPEAAARYRRFQHDERIPMATFTQAWATSNDLLIVTRATGN